jgi:hypothetical protein
MPKQTRAAGRPLNVIGCLALLHAIRAVRPAVGLDTRRKLAAKLTQDARK